MGFSLSFLGIFHIEGQGVTINGFRMQRARALLAYLAIGSDRPHE